jgi:hypothetical protein
MANPPDLLGKRIKAQKQTSPMPQAMGLVLFSPGQCLLKGSHVSKLRSGGSAIVPKKLLF